MAAEKARAKVINRATSPTSVTPAAQRPSLVTPTRLQTALRVSSPSDPAEREAESTARKIVHMPLAASAVRERAGVFRSPYVQRKAEGLPDTGANVAAEIENSRSSGQPLPLTVRRFMEPRFNADFRNVRVHTNEKAAALNNRIGARAFAIGNQIFFGRDQFQPETSEGRELIAHELTHTIQQGAVQQGEVAQRAQATVTQQTPTMVQRLGISDALDYFAEKAYIIPGYRMFTIILGVNPINMSRVERTPANILRGVIEFVPGGTLVTQALDNHGIIDRVANWVAEQIRALGITGSSIRDSIMRFLDSLSWRDIFRLGSVWERAKRIFTEPIGRIINFARNRVSTILRFIRDAILRPLARLAEGTRGYDLLKAVLGRDPITGDSYPRTAETLIGGFMKFIGQEEVWENIKRARAIPRAWAWFQGALSGLLAFVRQIPTLFIRALQSLTISDVVLLPRAFAKVAGVFFGLAGRFISWAGAQVMSLLQIIFEVVAPGAMRYIRRAAGAFRTIIRNPIGFVRNLVRAGILGFRQFAGNFLTHLRTSLIQWLTGSLSGLNIYIPQAFNLREIIKFILSVLGLTWQNIRQKLVRRIGETAVAALETTFDIVVTLVRDGPAAAWEKIVEQINNLRELVLEQIMTFVRDRIVQAAITRLVTSLNPAGAFIQAIIAIYNTIMFFVERLRQIAQVARSFIDSIAAIASGVITAAANRVEQTMAGLLTLVISFLARLVGLGRVSDAVTNIVNRIRAPIDRALDRIVAWVVGMAQRLGRLVASAATGGTPRTVQRPVRFAREGHHLRVVEQNNQFVIQMASDEFREIHDQLVLLRRNYLTSRRLERSGHGDAAAELDTRLRNILQRKNAIVQAAARDRANSARILEEGLGEIEGLVTELGEYMVTTYGQAFGPGAEAAVRSIVYVVREDRGFVVQDIHVIQGGELGIRAQSLDRTMATFLSYHSYGDEWRIPSQQEPPAYAGFAGSAGTGVRMTVNVRRGISLGGSAASIDPPGYSAAGSYNRRGHLVAQEFGGPGDRRNIVAMTFAANQTNAGMREIEIAVSQDLAKGNVVTYKATPDYGSRSHLMAPPEYIIVVADVVWPNPEPAKHRKRVSNK